MSKINLLIKHYRSYLVSFLLINFATTTGFSQSTVLPTAAQEAINKGIVAAKIPDYPLALKYFEEARKLAPSSPEIFFNLGLAESKIPGRELRAICWFGAYLTANPNTLNAAAVRGQINTLLVINQSNLVRFLNTVQDAVNQEIDILNDPKRSMNYIFFGSGVSELYGLPRIWIDAGDIAGAQKAVSFIKENKLKADNQYFIVIALVNAGDIAGAQKIADLIKDHPGRKSSAYKVISIAQAKSGDIPGALKNVDLITEAEDKADALYWIPFYQSRSGDFDGALKSVELILLQHLYDNMKSWVLIDIAKDYTRKGDISAALNIVSQLQDTAYRCQALTSIAEIQIEKGKLNDAKLTLISAQKTADSIQTRKKNDALNYIAAAKSKMGDIDGALKTLDLIQPIRERAYFSVVTAQIKIGDIAGAQKTTDLIQDAYTKDYVQKEIKKNQGNLSINVDDWLQKLGDDNKKNVCALNTQRFLDLAGYLKNLPPPDYPAKISFTDDKTGRIVPMASDDIYRVAESLYETAEKLVTAKSVIEKMLKELDENKK